MSACSGSRTAWLHEDPLAEAASRMRGTTVSLVDLTDDFCTTTTCYGVMGGVIMYSDNNHMTATYATTLAPYLAAPIETALTGRPPTAVHPIRHRCTAPVTRAAPRISPATAQHQGD